jgi:hypothetical protein
MQGQSDHFIHRFIGSARSKCKFLDLPKLLLNVASNDETASRANVSRVGLTNINSTDGGVLIWLDVERLIAIFETKAHL